MAIMDYKGSNRPKCRIPLLISKIEKIWMKEYKQLNFFQLLIFLEAEIKEEFIKEYPNSSSDSINLFYLEDNKLDSILKKLYPKTLN